MKLVVGLGNPGLLYRSTRHNVGARAVTAFARNHRFGLKADRSFKSIVAEGVYEGRNVMAALPQTFMNRSGDALALIAARKNLAPSDILIVMDDVELPLGALRVKPSGSDGGHNGLASVIGRLGTRDIARLRIGVGPRDPGRELADFVLSRFRLREKAAVSGAVADAARAIEIWIAQGLEACMNTTNKKRGNGEEPSEHE